MVVPTSKASAKETCSFKDLHARIGDQAALSHQTVPPAGGGQVESRSILGVRSGMASDGACYTRNQHLTVQQADRLPDTMLER